MVLIFLSGDIQKSTTDLAKETAECLKQLGRLDGGSDAETVSQGSK